MMAGKLKWVVTFSTWSNLAHFENVWKFSHVSPLFHRTPKSPWWSRVLWQVNGYPHKVQPWCFHCPTLYHIQTFMMKHSAPFQPNLKHAGTPFAPSRACHRLRRWRPFINGPQDRPNGLAVWCIPGQRVGLERMLVSKGFTSECFQTRSMSEIFNFLIAIDSQVRGWRPKPNVFWPLRDLPMFGHKIPPECGSPAVEMKLDFKYQDSGLSLGWAKFIVAKSLKHGM